jgi:hypothetical protein
VQVCKVSVYSKILDKKSTEAHGGVLSFDHRVGPKSNQFKNKTETFLSELTTHLGPTNTNSAMLVIIQVNSLEPHCVKNFNKMPKNMASKQAPKIIQNPHERRQ